eukprot:gene7683-9451_t
MEDNRIRSNSSPPDLNNNIESPPFSPPPSIIIEDKQQQQQQQQQQNSKSIIGKKSYHSSFFKSSKHKTYTYYNQFIFETFDDSNIENFIFIENIVIDWIHFHTKTKVIKPICDSLKSGVILCKLINSIKPSTIKKINYGNAKFAHIENLTSFAKGCETIGMTQDISRFNEYIFEDKENLVIQILHTLMKNCDKSYNPNSNSSSSASTSPPNGSTFTSPVVNQPPKILSKAPAIVPLSSTTTSSSTTIVRPLIPNRSSISTTPIVVPVQPLPPSSSSSSSSFTTATTNTSTTSQPYKFINKSRMLNNNNNNQSNNETTSTPPTNTISTTNNTPSTSTTPISSTTVLTVSPRKLPIPMPKTPPPNPSTTTTNCNNNEPQPTPSTTPPKNPSPPPQPTQTLPSSLSPRTIAPPLPPHHQPVSVQPQQYIQLIHEDASSVTSNQSTSSGGDNDTLSESSAIVGDSDSNSVSSTPSTTPNGTVRLKPSPPPPPPRNKNIPLTTSVDSSCSDSAAIDDIVEQQQQEATPVTTNKPQLPPKLSSSKESNGINESAPIHRNYSYNTISAASSSSTPSSPSISSSHSAIFSPPSSPITYLNNNNSSSSTNSSPSINGSSTTNQSPNIKKPRSSTKQKLEKFFSKSKLTGTKQPATVNLPASQPSNNQVSIKNMKFKKIGFSAPDLLLDDEDFDINGSVNDSFNFQNVMFSEIGTDHKPLPSIHHKDHNSHHNLHNSRDRDNQNHVNKDNTNPNHSTNKDNNHNHNNNNNNYNKDSTKLATSTSSLSSSMSSTCSQPAQPPPSLLSQSMNLPTSSSSQQQLLLSQQLQQQLLQSTSISNSTNTSQQQQPTTTTPILQQQQQQSLGSSGMNVFLKLSSGNGETSEVDPSSTSYDDLSATINNNSTEPGINNEELLKLINQLEFLYKDRKVLKERINFTYPDKYKSFVTYDEMLQLDTSPTFVSSSILSMPAKKQLEFFKNEERRMLSDIFTLKNVLNVVEENKALAIRVEEMQKMIDILIVEKKSMSAHFNEMLSAKAEAEAKRIEEEGIIFSEYKGKLEVKGGKTDRLVERLYNKTVVGSQYVDCFLLTYRTFITSKQVLAMLTRTYNDHAPIDETGGEPERQFQVEQENLARKKTRLRICNFLKRWVENFFHDFDSELITEYNQFISNCTEEKIQTMLRRTLDKKLNGNTIAKQTSFGKSAPLPLIPKTPISSFEDIDPTEIARQLTLIEFELFRNIASKELLSLSWQKSDKEVRSPNLLKMIHRFNEVSNWVTTTIVRETNLRKRAQNIKRFIKLTEELRKLNNFNGMFVVVSALHSASVNRLQKTWGECSKQQLKQFDEFVALTSPNSSFAAYREELHKADMPCIPYLGVHLSDLTFIEEGNPDKLENGFINFFKCRMVAEVIKEIQQYQQQPYNLISVPEVTSTLLNHKIVSESECFKLSLIAEPRESSISN